MKKILYVSPFLNKNRFGGGIVSQSNFEAIKLLFDNDVYSVSFSDSKSNIIEDGNSFVLPEESSKFRIAIGNLCLKPLRLNGQSLCLLKKILLNLNPEIVYLDSSCLGSIAKWIKKNLPDIYVITFYHNVEYDFEVSRLLSGDIKFLPSFFSVFFNERNAARYSDHIISLHNTDAKRINKLYNSKVKSLVPVVVNDPVVVESGKGKVSCTNKTTFGFFGSAFFANVEAARNIKKLAVKNADKKFIIAGRGFDKYKSELSGINLEVIGEIDSVADFYGMIDVFLAPVYTGGGMKVKIAEAMSYNLPIIASEFCLIGYEDYIDGKSIISCNTDQELLASIDELGCLGDLIGRDTYKYFCSAFSYESNITRFKQIFEEINYVK
ncbi:TPA: glycosyltransferase family 4 protein [Vibrio parahaemolyticus]|nr:glycosyltransferase family 4 protein [Vibrio parahaemolyticus]